MRWYGRRKCGMVWCGVRTRGMTWHGGRRKMWLWNEKVRNEVVWNTYLIPHLLIPHHIVPHVLIPSHVVPCFLIPMPLHSIPPPYSTPLVMPLSSSASLFHAASFQTHYSLSPHFPSTYTLLFHAFHSPPWHSLIPQPPHPISYLLIPHPITTHIKTTPEISKNK